MVTNHYLIQKQPKITFYCNILVAASRHCIVLSCPLFTTDRAKCQQISNQRGQKPDRYTSGIILRQKAYIDQPFQLPNIFNHPLTLLWKQLLTCWQCLHIGGPPSPHQPFLSLHPCPLPSLYSKGGNSRTSNRLPRRPSGIFRAFGQYSWLRICKNVVAENCLIIDTVAFQTESHFSKGTIKIICFAKKFYYQPVCREWSVKSIGYKSF